MRFSFCFKLFIRFRFRLNIYRRLIAQVAQHVKSMSIQDQSHNWLNSSMCVIKTFPSRFVSRELVIEKAFSAAFYWKFESFRWKLSWKITNVIVLSNDFVEAIGNNFSGRVKFPLLSCLDVHMWADFDLK